ARVSTRRRNATRPREIRNIRSTVVILEAERNVLARHVVERGRDVPGFKRLTRILRKVRRSGDGRRSVNRWQEHQIAAWIVNLASPKCHGVNVPVKPEAVVEHVAEKALLGPLSGVTSAAHTTTVLAAHVAGQRESHSIQGTVRILVVHPLNAVIGVITNPAGNAERVCAQNVLVAQHLKLAIRTP